MKVSPGLGLDVSVFVCIHSDMSQNTWTGEEEVDTILKKITKGQHNDKLFIFHCFNNPEHLCILTKALSQLRLKLH